MPETAFDFIVVGRGMMGAAAARHLSRMTPARIALIGPGEPQDWAAHDGVFASHYDSGRITRTIDPDLVWATLANRSIARYREIEAESGVSFFRETGCLIAGPDTEPPDDAMGRVLDVARRFALDASTLDAAGLEARFPWFSLGPYRLGVFEAKGAGQIDPRRLVEAQTICARKGGVTLIDCDVASIAHRGDHAAVVTADGRTFAGGVVLLAAGAFSIGGGLLPDPLDLTVKARTAVLAEVGEAVAADWAEMPSLIIETDRPEDDVYVLPPIRYPDGRIYVKIGGDPSDIVLEREADIRDWFRGGDNPAAAMHLESVLRRLIPTLDPLAVRTTRCVTSFTRHARPYVGFACVPTVAVLTGGNGKAAKSSDEIGRLGAALLVNGRLDETEYDAEFSVRFR